jgi:phenylpropionate dioxygenase-like ring-hydroxylating dioxygenase large terminal subunit
MIRNQWYVVLNSNQVKEKPVGVTRLDEKLVFWRDGDGQVNCAFDRCPHRGVQLSKGYLVDHHLQCPFHGFEYDSSGKCVLIPAEGRVSQPPSAMRLQTYPTFEDHDFIWIWWGIDPPDTLEQPTFFDNLGPEFSYGSAIDPWDAHYSRVIENQLDVAHLPFVHTNTIGRGNRTLVDGPLVDWCDDNKKIMCTYVFNRVDDGSKPRRTNELSKKGSLVHLEFIMPNLWQNYLGKDTRILAAFVPVDGEHTLLYLRFYQNFIKTPVLGKLIAQLSMPFNLYIAHQDRAVVETQQPKASSLKGGNEKPIKADNPIILYRRMREKLKESI